MRNHLVRRGGIWWVRLVVPARLRNAAGRREFIQSCRTHELAIAKLVAAVLLTDWRKKLLQLDCRQMSFDVLKIVDGSPVLHGGGYVPLSEAARLSGIKLNQLLRAIADGALRLFCRVSNLCGHLVDYESLDPIDAVAGRSCGVVIPQPQQMPALAMESTQTGVLMVVRADVVAATVLANGLNSVEIVAFGVSDQPGMLFAPVTTVVLEVERFEVLAAEVEALRRTMATSVSPDAIKHARELEKVAAVGVATSAGKKAHKLFSEALEAYAITASGIPGSLTSLAEQKQKRRGCELFIELVGDLTLQEVTADRLQEFREKLKKLPAKVNHIPIEFRRKTVADTVQALVDGGIEWPMMSEAARHERMQWLDQMFRWLVARKWLRDNPVTAVLEEKTKTAAERKAEMHARALRKSLDDDSDDREPFTPEELRRIFSQTHYKTGNGLHVGGNSKWYPFEYWLPIIALHAGCRIKELSQLHLSDIRQSADGAWYFDINENTVDKSLKNDSATRQIPLSPVLIELGLIEYLTKLKSEGFRRLFPELTWAKSDAKYAKESGRKMSAMFGKLGMPRDGSKVFHCLRANFNDAMLRVPLASLPFDNPKLVVFAQMTIFGHMIADVNGKHYTSAAMSEKLRFVSGIRYDLPEIAKFDIGFGIKQVRVAIDNKEGERWGREDMGPLDTD